MVIRNVQPYLVAVKTNPPANPVAQNDTHAEKKPKDARRP